MLRWLLIYQVMQTASNRGSSVLWRGALILLMCCAGAAARAGGWPVFRGNPALTGVAAGTLPAKPSLLWSFKTGGPVKSSAVIGGGKVFIGSNDGQIRALEFASGRQVWAFKAGSAVQAPPLLANNAVFAGDTDGVFYSINAADGRPTLEIRHRGQDPRLGQRRAQRRRPAAHSGRKLRFQTLLLRRHQRHPRLDLRNGQLHQRLLRRGRRPGRLRRMRRAGPRPQRRHRREGQGN